MKKKPYRLYLTEEGEFKTTLRIPTFDRIALADKHRITLEQDGIYINGYELNLTKEEYLIFKATYKNYILLFEEMKPSDRYCKGIIKGQ